MKNHVEKNYVEAERGYPAFLTLSWAWQDSLEDPAAVKAALARNLRRYRESAGLNQKTLAKRAATSLAMIRSIEAGQSLPDIATLVRLGDALGAPCSALADCGAPMAKVSQESRPASNLAREARAALA